MISYNEEWKIKSMNINETFLILRFHSNSSSNIYILKEIAFI